MSKSIEIEGKIFVSPIVASKATDFTNDYVTRLAREGKINAYKIGREWFVDPQSLAEFVKAMAERRSDNRQGLREIRKKEHADSQLRLKSLEKREEVSRSRLRRGKLSAIAQTCAILLI